MPDIRTNSSPAKHKERKGYPRGKIGGMAFIVGLSVDSNNVVATERSPVVNHAHWESFDFRRNPEGTFAMMDFPTNGAAYIFWRDLRLG